jgi:GH25 family lysozyme M1 (1,4-beta-N-acetylmuramidase)
VPLLVDLYQRYNNVTDWNALARAVGGAYVKYSDGTGGASTPADNYATRCRVASIPYGGYHFAQPGDPVAQARVFLAQYARLGGNLAPALDLESGDIPYAARGNFARQFLETVHAQYPIVVLYASASWLATLRPDTWPYDWDRTWVAAYGNNDGTRHALTGYGGRVDMHQYTSSGRVAGVSGAVDLDWTDNLDAFRLDQTAGSGSAPVSEDDDNMLVPAGTNEHVSLIVKGKSRVYLGCAYGRKVTAHQIVWCGDTTGTAPAYLPGGADTDWTFDPGRPGPLTPPAGAAQMIVRYTADHSFTLAAV